MRIIEESGGESKTKFKSDGFHDVSLTSWQCPSEICIQPFLRSDTLSAILRWLSYLIRRSKIDEIGLVPIYCYHSLSHIMFSAAFDKLYFNLC